MEAALSTPEVHGPGSTGFGGDMGPAQQVDLNDDSSMLGMGLSPNASAQPAPNQSSISSPAFSMPSSASGVGMSVLIQVPHHGSQGVGPPPTMSAQTSGGSHPATPQPTAAPPASASTLGDGTSPPQPQPQHQSTPSPTSTSQQSGPPQPGSLSEAGGGEGFTPNGNAPAAERDASASPAAPLQQPEQSPSSAPAQPPPAPPQPQPDAELLSSSGSPSLPAIQDPSTGAMISSSSPTTDASTPPPPLAPAQTSVPSPPDLQQHTSHSVAAPQQLSVSSPPLSSPLQPPMQGQTQMPALQGHQQTPVQHPSQMGFAQGGLMPPQQQQPMQHQHQQMLQQHQQPPGAMPGFHPSPYAQQQPQTGAPSPQQHMSPQQQQQQQQHQQQQQQQQQQHQQQQQQPHMQQMMLDQQHMSHQAGQQPGIRGMPPAVANASFVQHSPGLHVPAIGQLPPGYNPQMAHMPMTMQQQQPAPQQQQPGQPQPQTPQQLASQQQQQQMAAAAAQAHQMRMAQMGQPGMANAPPGAYNPMMHGIGAPQTPQQMQQLMGSPVMTNGMPTMAMGPMGPVMMAPPGQQQPQQGQPPPQMMMNGPMGAATPQQQQQMVMQQQQPGQPVVNNPQGTPQQGPMQMPHQQQRGMNSAEVKAMRERMINQIIVMLQQRSRPQAQAQGGGEGKPVLENRLREMAIRLEEHLWKRANNNMAAYNDINTLKARLQALATHMGSRRQHPGQQQAAQPGAQGQPPQGQTPRNAQGVGVPPGMTPMAPPQQMPPGGGGYAPRGPMQQGGVPPHMAGMQPGQPQAHMIQAQQQQLQQQHQQAQMRAQAGVPQQPQQQPGMATPGVQVPGAMGGAYYPRGAMPPRAIVMNGPSMPGQPPNTQFVGMGQMAPMYGDPAAMQQQQQQQQQQAQQQQGMAMAQPYLQQPGGKQGPPQPSPLHQGAPGGQMQVPPLQQPHTPSMVGAPGGLPPNGGQQVGGMVAGPVGPGGTPRMSMAQPGGMGLGLVQSGQPGGVPGVQPARPQHTPEQRQQILHQQQQRLLYLRHASKCTHVDGKCPQGYPNCTGMKELWKHIAACRETRCQYPHCVSSRYVLSHYHKCKDEACPVCGPVRNTIRSARGGLGGPGGLGMPDEAMAPCMTGLSPTFVTAQQLLLQPHQPLTHHTGLPTPGMPPQQQAGVYAGGMQQVPPGAPRPAMVVPGQPMPGAPQQAMQPQQILPPQQQPQQQPQMMTASPTANGAARGTRSATRAAVGQQQQQQQPGFLPGAVSTPLPPPAVGNPNTLIAVTSGPPTSRGAVPPQQAVVGARRPAPDGAMDGQPNSKMMRMSPRVGPVQQQQQGMQGVAGVPSPQQQQLQPQVPQGVQPMQMSPQQQQQQAQVGVVQPKKEQWQQPQQPQQQQAPHPGPSFRGPPQAPQPQAQSFYAQAQSSAMTTQQTAAMLQKFEESVSLANAFTEEQMMAHMESLRSAGYITPQKIKQKCMPVLNKLLKSEYGWIFEEPVDPAKLGLPDYFDVIKQPMDLGTVRRKLETGSYYQELDQLASDVKLTFDNAILYNPPGQEIHKVARDMRDMFFRDFRALEMEIRKEQDATVAKGESCLLCGCEKLYYEPPIYYCNGSGCNNSRIRRNSYYYSGGRNQYHWCVPCYGDIKGEEIQVGGTILKKSELTKEKNDKMAEEPWVACDKCQQWVHQVCALFNVRNNQGDAVKYYCPRCTLERRRLTGQGPTCAPLSAKALKHCNFSQYLENRVVARLEQCYRDQAREQGVTYTGEEFNKHPVYVRQVLNTEKTFPVRERMLRRYAAQDYPSEFQAKSRCVVLFQNIDGVDVILFAMYVYEYGHTCPLPNQRRVYISYLDSVHYFRPREFRTTVYHEILIAYLAYVKERGFHTAHIWACPPYKGDDYILHCHPQDQKVPKDDRLRKWYQTMLESAKEEGIVEDITNLYQDSFLDPNNDATILPYMEGDYWIGEAENLIKEIEEEEKEAPTTENDTVASSKKRRSQKKKTSKRSLRRLADGTPVPESRDPLMERLGAIIDQMKDSFIVAKLRPLEFVRQCAERLAADTAAARLKAESAPPPPPPTYLPASSSPAMQQQQMNGGAVQDGALALAVGGGESLMNGADGQQVKVEVKADPSTSSPATMVIVGNSNGPTDETADHDRSEECEIFDTRSDFLDFCKGNHYQFDVLRRAKHSSMMTLYHLMNPDAPKFLPMCVVCNKEINGTYKWSCPCEEDFCLCQECYNAGYHRNHPQHKLQQTAIRTRAGEGGEGGSADMLRQKEMLRRHLELLVHSCTCNKEHCIPNCLKMRELLAHVHECHIKVGGGCKKCRRVWLLLQYHAKTCKVRDCRVPRCAQFREAYRLRQLQQLQMEDRRRAAQNSTIGYRAQTKPNTEDDEESTVATVAPGGTGGGKGKQPGPAILGHGKGAA